MNAVRARLGFPVLLSFSDFFFLLVLLLQLLLLLPQPFPLIVVDNVEFGEISVLHSSLKLVLPFSLRADGDAALLSASTAISLLLSLIL